MPSVRDVPPKHVFGDGVKIVNNGQVQVEGDTLDVAVAKYPWSKMRGMMFREWDEVGDGMLFPFRYEDKWGVEMFFSPKMDVVFLDKKKRVVDVQEARPITMNPKTWKIHRPKKRCKYVLELPRGKGRRFERGKKVGLTF